MSKTTVWILPVPIFCLALARVDATELEILGCAAALIFNGAGRRCAMPETRARAHT